MTRIARNAAVAGTVAAAAYGVLKLAWAFGSGIGISDPAAMRDAFGASFGLATWGTSILALVAAAIMWWRATGGGRQGVAVGLCWAGAVVMLIPGVLGTGAVILTLLGVITTPEDPLIALWVDGLVYPSFVVMAAAFAVLALQRPTPAS